jgi:hypothetical protein
MGCDIRCCLDPTYKRCDQCKKTEYCKPHSGVGCECLGCGLYVCNHCESNVMNYCKSCNK